jgi:hypothetical protein
MTRAPCRSVFAVMCEVFVQTPTSTSSRKTPNRSAILVCVSPVILPASFALALCNTAASNGSSFLAVSMNANRNDFARAGSAAAASKRAQISCSSSLLSSAAAVRIGSVIERLAGSRASTARNRSLALSSMRAGSQRAEPSADLHRAGPLSLREWCQTSLSGSRLALVGS